MVDMFRSCCSPWYKRSGRKGKPKRKGSSGPISASRHMVPHVHSRTEHGGRIWRQGSTSSSSSSPTVYSASSWSLSQFPDEISNEAQDATGVADPEFQREHQKGSPKSSSPTTSSCDKNVDLDVASTSMWSFPLEPGILSRNMDMELHKLQRVVRSLEDILACLEDDTDSMDTEDRVGLVGTGIVVDYDELTLAEMSVLSGLDAGDLYQRPSSPTSTLYGTKSYSSSPATSMATGLECPSHIRHSDHLSWITQSSRHRNITSIVAQNVMLGLCEPGPCDLGLKRECHSLESAVGENGRTDPDGEPGRSCVGTQTQTEGVYDVSLLTSHITQETSCQPIGSTDTVFSDEVDTNGMFSTVTYMFEDDVETRSIVTTENTGIAGETVRPVDADRWYTETPEDPDDLNGMVNIEMKAAGAEDTSVLDVRTGTYQIGTSNDPVIEGGQSREQLANKGKAKMAQTENSMPHMGNAGVEVWGVETNALKNTLRPMDEIEGKNEPRYIWTLPEEVTTDSKTSSIQYTTGFELPELAFRGPTVQGRRDGRRRCTHRCSSCKVSCCLPGEGIRVVCKEFSKILKCKFRPYVTNMSNMID